MDMHQYKLIGDGSEVCLLRLLHGDANHVDYRAVDLPEADDVGALSLADVLAAATRDNAQHS